MVYHLRKQLCWKWRKVYFILLHNFVHDFWKKHSKVHVSSPRYMQAPEAHTNFFQPLNSTFMWTSNFYYMSMYLNPIQDGLLRGWSRMEGPKRPPIPKICHIYPTMMKLGTVISYLKKIQKIYESRDTRLGFCWHHHFFTRNQQILLYQEIQI